MWLSIMSKNTFLKGDSSQLMLVEKMSSNLDQANPTLAKPIDSYATCKVLVKLL